MALDPKNEPRARNQIVTPRSSRRLDRARSRRRSAIDIGKILRAAAAFARPAAVLAAVVLMVLGYNALADSRLFLLNRVTISEADPALRGDIEQMVRRAVGQTRLMDVDLSALRQKIEAVPRVRGASVARLLPDGIFVRVVERQPAVLVRRDSEALVWLDDDAVEMGEFSDVKRAGSSSKPGAATEIPPIAKGFAEGNRSQSAIAEDRERIAIYKQIEREFSEEPNPLWNLIDQIDLTFTKDVNMRLAHPPVLIHIGSTDFRKRFEKALQVLQAVKQGDSELPSRFRVQDIDRLIQNANNISFIDAARGDRIVVNIATPGVPRAVRQESIPDKSPKKKK
ncbi:MAG: FtsQ-type POTRA domain-containing protein [Acidobacteriota bacterium]